MPDTTRFEARSYEIDPYGHLNNAVFVNWCEHARLAFLRARGLSYTSIHDVHGVRIVVVQQDVSYRAEVHLGDTIDVTTRIVRFGRTSFTFEHALAAASGEPAGLAKVTMVCTGADGRPTPMPPALRDALA